MVSGAQCPSDRDAAGNKAHGAPKAMRFLGPILASLGLATLTLLAFSPLLSADFINYDDPMFVAGNPHVSAGLTREGLRWAFTTMHMGFYYPLTLISHMLDCQLFGLWAGGHHLVSILIHVASALLLLTVLRRASGSLWPSVLVAALFALHPLHVESVAWIAERKDVLSTFFLMLTLLAYVEYGRCRSPGRYAVIALLFLCALLSKAMVVTTPFLLLLMDYWPLGRLDLGGAQVSGEPGALGGKNRVLSFRRLVIEKTPLLALSMIFIGITFVAQRSAITPLERVPSLLRCQNAFISYAGYIGKLFVPANLAIFYPFQIQAVTLAKVALAATLLLLITVLAWRYRGRRPYILMGWLWYLGALVPVIGVLQVGGQSSADRYTYVPSIGLFIILAWSAAEIPLRTTARKTSAAIAAGVAVAAMGVVTWAQARTWHDSATLFRHAVQVTKDNYLAHTMLGVELQKEGDLRGAADQLKEAVRLTPDYVDAWGDLGNLFERQGKLEEAAACYQQILVLDPKDSRSDANLGLVRELQGRLEDAEAAFARASARSPGNASYRLNLGRVQAQLGKTGEARRSFAEVVRVNPASREAFYYLGLLDAKVGNLAEAEANYRRALALAPELEPARTKLASLLQGQGRFAEAQAILAGGAPAGKHTAVP